MQISRVLRTAFLLVLSLSLASVLGYANEPAEDIFHKGVQVFQSGDKIAAVKLFITSANAGNTKAAAQVGWCYEFGVGVPQNLAEAAKWYRRIRAARS